MPEADALALTDDLALIRDAAAEAGAIAMRYFGSDPQVWMKEGDSPVSEADYAVDLFLRETLTAARPDYGWLSEETVDTGARTRGHRLFVVDPIDGTRAFLGGRDLWCVSIAVVEAGRPVSAVLDCPARNERFEAIAGRPALRDGEPIAVASRPRPVVAGPKNIISRAPAALRDRIDSHPYIPSLAYRLAMVADGRLDATFVKSNSCDWDLAAADLILAAAGGSIRTATGAVPTYGDDADPRHGSLAAGSGALLDEMVSVLAGIEA